MKKKTTAILLALMLLAGCKTAPAAAPAPTPESTLTVSAPAVPESTPAEEPTPPEEPTPAEETVPPEESQPEQEALPPQEEPAPQEEEPAPLEQEPQPEPAETVSYQPTAAPSSYDGFDLKNLYPAFIWENFQPTEEGQSSDDAWEWEYEDEEPQNPSGFLREDDAWTVIQLINKEREKHGLESLPVDGDLMELAQVRAIELRESYDHTRPDGTSVVDLRCGENIGRRYSAKEQVESWMNSECHRKNNLSERYHHIGAACYQAENGNLYWVAVFSLD